MADYDNIALYYDTEYADFDDDIDLYRQYAKLVGSPILDLACGTGRVAIALAQDGYRVTGVDVSSEMLKLANAKADERGCSSRVSFVLGDISDGVDVCSVGQFAMAIVPLGSFGHILDTARQRAALRWIRDSLRPGGMLLIDLPNPATQLYPPSSGELVRQAILNVGGREVTKFVSRVTDLGSQTEDTVLLYDEIGSSGIVKRTQASFVLRYLFRYEMELLLEGAGFEVREVFGDYELSEYNGESDRLVFVASRWQK